MAPLRNSRGFIGGVELSLALLNGLAKLGVELGSQLRHIIHPYIVLPIYGVTRVQLDFEDSASALSPDNAVLLHETDGQIDACSAGSPEAAPLPAAGSDSWKPNTPGMSGQKEGRPLSLEEPMWRRRL
jgi:hypothetical protein